MRERTAAEWVQGMDSRSEYYDVNLGLTPITEGWWALLVYDAAEPVEAVEQILVRQGMSIRRVRNCSAANAALREESPPALVLTDTSLPDGSWADVLKAACAVPSTPPVIVVSRVINIRLYLDVLECGAHDFVVPPFTSVDLAHIVGGALLKGSHRGPGKTECDQARHPGDRDEDPTNRPAK